MEMLSQKSPATLLTVPWRGGISALRSAGAEMIVVTVSFMHFSQPHSKLVLYSNYFPKRRAKNPFFFIS